MPKRAPLSVSALKAAVAGTALVVPKTIAAATPLTHEGGRAWAQPSRVGKTNITGYFPVEVKNSLRQVQILTGRNFQQLLGEALTDLFRKYNVPVPMIEEEGENS